MASASSAGTAGAVDLDADIQMVGGGDEEEEEEVQVVGVERGGISTPKGGTRTPTGLTPEPKKSRLTPEEEVEEGREMGERGRYPQGAPGGPSYSGMPVPPPGIIPPVNPQGVAEQPPSRHRHTNATRFQDGGGTGSTIEGRHKS